MRIYLRKLRLSGFRSFADESCIEFPTAGFLLVRGKNVDTGGSSGSGKSSLLMAIAYLLGYAEYPSTQLESWSEEALRVEGEFLRGEDCLEVTRGASGLRLVENGVPLEGSSKQLEAELVRFMGQPPELLEALTYRSQKSPGIFLSKGDAEKKDFLARVLDLTKFETAAGTAGARVKEAETKVVEKSAKAAALSDAAAKLAAELLATPPETDALKKTADSAARSVLELENVHEGLSVKIAAFENELKADVACLEVIAKTEEATLVRELKELNAQQPDYSAVDESGVLAIQADLTQVEQFLSEERAADAAKLKEQNRQLAVIDQCLQQMLRDYAQLEPKTKALAESLAKIEKLSANVCPTCDRVWDESAAAQRALEAQAAQLNFEIERIQSMGPEIDTVSAEKKKLMIFTPSKEISELEQVRTKLSMDLEVQRQVIARKKEAMREDFESGKTEQREELQTRLNIVRSRVVNYKSDRTESMQGLYEQLEDNNRSLTVARSALHGAKNALIQAETSAAHIIAANKAHAKKLADAQAELEVALAEQAEAIKVRDEECDFQLLVGREGFLGSIFDEVLWEVSSETNKILAQVPNTAHVTLHFRSESSTQKGTIQRRIVPVVTVGGFETSIKSGLSGGMATAVELAVDLAVSNVVTRRSGVSPNWLVLDEAFTGLGPVEMEACMEMLRNSTNDKLVLVVDHSSEFKSLFSQFVDVEFTNGRSKVVSR